MQGLVVDLHVPGTVHRLDRVLAVLRTRREHHVAELGPGPGAFPQRAIDDLGRVDLPVTARIQLLADVRDSGLVSAEFVVSHVSG